ncbi:hypothetical protein ACNKHM_04710 [Shigella sonnei]
MRLEQFEVNQQRDALFQSDAFVSQLEEGHTNEVNSEVHDALLQVVICVANCWMGLTNSWVTS